MNLAKYIDHTILKVDATKNDIKKLCEEAMEYGFKSVCINACHVKYAKELLKDSDVLIATVVGFPLGATTTETKAFEAKQAVENGASEIDMVINVGALKDGDYDFVLNDIKTVVDSCKVTVKVILETCKLTKEEIVMATKLAVKAKAHFVKTSTGFSDGGAKVEDVKLMKENCGSLEVKASGGVRDKKTALEMIEAGATRIGTSSGIKIILG